MVWGWILPYTPFFEPLPEQLLTGIKSLKGTDMNKAIYCSLLELPGDLDVGGNFLSPVEQEKLASLRFAKRRTEWLLGRWTAKRLLRDSLSAFSSYMLPELTIANDAAGAPYVILPGGRRFAGCLSISHCNHLSFCAVTADPSLHIGADLEHIEARGVEFAQDYFTSHELNFVLDLPASLRDTAVTLLWSAKESALKALGLGLRLDTRQVEITVPGGLVGKDLSTPTWQTFNVAIHHAGQGTWSGWWQIQGTYILTLASLKAPWASRADYFSLNTLYQSVVPSFTLGSLHQSTMS
jgi:4'-phosphopantetheinyl transferase